MYVTTSKSSVSTPSSIRQRLPPAPIVVQMDDYVKIDSDVKQVIPRFERTDVSDESADSKISSASSPPSGLHFGDKVNSFVPAGISFQQYWELATDRPCPIDQNGQLLSAVDLSDDGRGHKTGKHKQLTNYIPLTTIDYKSTATPYLIGAISQGDGYFDRVGMQVINRHLTLRFMTASYYQQSTANTAYLTAVPPRIRIVLSYDRLAGAAFGADVRQWNDSADSDPPVSVSSLMASVGLVTHMGGNAGNSFFPYNYNTHGTRYNILRDEVVTHDVGENAGALINGSTIWRCYQKRHEWNVPLKDLVTTYGDNTNTTVMSNELVLWVICDQQPTVPPSAGQWVSQIVGSYALRFDDIATV